MPKNKIRKTISLDPLLYKTAQQIATKDKRTFSNLMSLLIEKFIDKN